MVESLFGEVIGRKVDGSIWCHTYLDGEAEPSRHHARDIDLEAVPLDSRGKEQDRFWGFKSSQKRHLDRNLAAPPHQGWHKTLV